MKTHPIAAIASFLSDHLYGPHDEPLPEQIGVLELPREPGRSGNARPVTRAFENETLNQKILRAEEYIVGNAAACANRMKSVMMLRRRYPARLHDETVELKLVVSNPDEFESKQRSAARKLELVR